MNKGNMLLTVFSFLISVSVSSQILAPATWECDVSKKEVKKGDLVELVFNVQLDDTWHLYSNVQNYELGPMPAVFEFEPNDSFELIGNIVPIGFNTKYDEIFEVDVNYFKHTAEFRQKVKILSKDPIIKGYYEYQVCTTVDGMCIMGENDFVFRIGQ